MAYFYNYPANGPRILSKNSSCTIRQLPNELDTMQQHQHDSDKKAVFRILDVNINRLREGLRVVEEGFRFAETDKNNALKLKTIRHSIEEIENSLGSANLLEGRDAAGDMFANTNRPEELNRSSVKDIFISNIKRAQEASRVLEEYCKLTPVPHTSEQAKTIRFTLYTIEKEVMEQTGYGAQEKRS